MECFECKVSYVITTIVTGKLCMPNEDKNEQQDMNEKPSKLVYVAWVSCICVLVPFLNFLAVVLTPVTALILLFSKDRINQRHGRICFVVYIVLLIGFFLSISPRLPDAILRQRLFLSTPLGTKMADVQKYILKKRWRIDCIAEDGGIPYQGNDETIKKTGRRIGDKHIRADLGDYTSPILFLENATVFWGFDKQSRLVDIWVWKTIDAP